MRNYIRFKIKYVPILLILCGCTNSTAPVTSPSLQQVNAPLANNLNPSVNDRSLPPKQDSPDSANEPKIAGSKVPGPPIISKDKAIICRVKEWASYPLGNDIKLEFTNLASQKPVNIVYTLMAKSSDKKIIRLYNYYIDRQSDITDFSPPLKKGESGIVDAGIKHVAASSVELQGCRVARENENFLTINPEMKGYKGP
jgi:hypothetical protein